MDNFQIIGIDPETGLRVGREVDYFIGGIKEPKITVHYREWLVSPTNVRLEPFKAKKYIIIDIPAVMKAGELVLDTPEVLAEDGVTVVSEAVYTQSEDVVDIPALPEYTYWKDRVILKEYVGYRLGQDLILGDINRTLLTLIPIGAEDNYILKTN